MSLQKGKFGDFHDSKVLKALRFYRNGHGFDPGQEARSHMPHHTAKNIIIIKGNSDKACMWKEHCVKTKAESGVQQRPRTQRLGSKTAELGEKPQCLRIPEQPAHY